MAESPRSSSPDTDVDVDERIHRFLLDCSQALVDRAETTDAERGAAAYAAALADSTPLSFQPKRLPVLDTLDRVDINGGGQPAAGFADVAQLLPWTPTRRAEDGGTEFGLALLDSVREFGPTTVGVMYVAPGAQYPLHHHRPQELYLTLCGTARWRFGGAEDFVERGPGRTLYNHPDDLHSALAGETPLVALYVLWDDD